MVELTARARNVLEAALPYGVEITPATVAKTLSERGLLLSPNCGKLTVTNIREWLAHHGYVFGGRNSVDSLKDELALMGRVVNELEDRLSALEARFRVRHVPVESDEVYIVSTDEDGREVHTFVDFDSRSVTEWRER